MRGAPRRGRPRRCSWAAAATLAAMFLGGSSDVGGAGWAMKPVCLGPGPPCCCDILELERRFRCSVRSYRFPWERRWYRRSRGASPRSNRSSAPRASRAPPRASVSARTTPSRPRSPPSASSSSRTPRHRSASSSSAYASPCRAVVTPGRDSCRWPLWGASTVAATAS